jgi:hypothetical protein
MVGLGGMVGGSEDPRCRLLKPCLRLNLDLGLGRGRGLHASASTKALNELSRSRSGTAHGKRRRSMQTYLRSVSFRISEFGRRKESSRIWMDEVTVP